MKKQDKAAKKKRTILAVSAVGVLVLIGGVIAYNRNQQFFNNLFHLGSTDDESFIEVFDSPQNWACQEETPKSIHYENGSGYTRAVRVKYEDYWKRKDSTSTDHETELPKEKDGKSLTKINFQNEELWILNQDGWYYYKYEVPNGGMTDDFMKSVVFDCDFEETEEYECTMTATGKECESGESDYMDATYHVYITIQATTEPSTVAGWSYTPEVFSEYLYDYIADRTNGSDAGIDYKTGANENTKEKGIYTYAEHAGDEYPVYFYRGAVKNNFVIFNDICWQILRTTDTGGTKMIYSGAPDENGKCSANSTGIAETEYNAYEGKQNAAYVGYVAGSNSSYATTQLTTSSGQYANGNYYGNDVEWNGSQYTLVNTIHPTSKWNDYEDDVDKRYHYTCGTTSATCESVYYIIASRGYSIGQNGAVYAISLSNGDTLETVKQEVFNNSDGADSDIKTVVDNWFRDNMTSVASRIEDTVYCGDRTFSRGTLYGLTTEDLLYDWDGSEFGIESRSPDYHNTGNKPIVDCPRKVDSYTVGNTGNGKLTYPVGLLTTDEAILGGAFPVTKDKPFESNGEFWTMTPDGVGRGFDWIVSTVGSNEGVIGRSAGISLYVRPVISLTHATKINGGNGTADKPFTLKWDN